MTKHSFGATPLVLLAAVLVIPSALAGPAQTSKAADPAAQENRCYVVVEVTNPKAKKDTTKNEVPCNKVSWGPTTGSAPLGKKECLDQSARIGKIRLQRDGKTGESSKSCFVQQFARAANTGSQR